MLRVPFVGFHYRWTNQSWITMRILILMFLVFAFVGVFIVLTLRISTLLLQMVVCLFVCFFNTFINYIACVCMCVLVFRCFLSKFSYSLYIIIKWIVVSFKYLLAPLKFFVLLVFHSTICGSHAFIDWTSRCFLLLFICRCRQFMTLNFNMFACYFVCFRWKWHDGWNVS